MVVAVGDRRASLELILPMAQLFQDGVNQMQRCFISTEQELAELRNAERAMLHLAEATERAKVENISASRTYHGNHSHNNNNTFNTFQVVVEEIQIKSADLGEIQKSAHDLMKALSGDVFAQLMFACEHARGLC